MSENADGVDGLTKAEIECGNGIIQPEDRSEGGRIIRQTIIVNH